MLSSESISGIVLFRARIACQCVRRFPHCGGCTDGLFLSEGAFFKGNFLLSKIKSRVKSQEIYNSLFSCGHLTTKVAQCCSSHQMKRACFRMAGF
ncbi:hypothetical protein PSAC2689_160173 [Paraburkholderia sacchari]